MAIKGKIVKKACVRCERNLEPTRNFYKINGIDPAFPDNRYPLCRTCCDELVSDELTGHKAFLRILMSTNRAFRDDFFNECGRDRVKYLNSMQNGKKVDILKEFLDSDSLFTKENYEMDEGNLDKLTPEELRECELYWGVGDYTEDDYIYLLSRYESYCNAYDVDSPSFEGIVAQICQLELDARKKKIKGLDSKKDLELMIKLMNTAGISPSQEKESKNNDANVFGNMVKRWENEHPVPEPLEQFKDVDGIAKHIRNDFLSPMLTSLEADNPFQDEYDEHIKENGISKEELLGIESD